MARGRKPKPLEQRQAEGNRGNRPLPEPLKSAPLDRTAPKILGPAGRDLWEEMMRLADAGVLDQVDRIGLTALCVQWDRAAEAARVLDEQGHYAKGSMGQVVPHPALAIERAAHSALFKFLAEYAATPVARARIQTARMHRQQAQEFEELTRGDVVDIEGLEEIDPEAL